MGLDTLELVLSVEESFEIEISDGVAETLQSVGDLHAFVVSELIRLNRPNVNEDIVFDILKNLICYHHGVRAEQVVLGAHFIRDLHAD